MSNKYVGRFDVPMNDPLAVHVGNCVQYATQNESNTFQFKLGCRKLYGFFSAQIASLLIIFIE